MQKRSGFTLIELLVVIAIIAILAAVLFPVFSLAKKSAQTTGCLANLRQLYTACSNYSNDYEGDLPCMIVPWEWDDDARRTTYMKYFLHKQLGPYLKDEGVCSCSAWKAIEQHPATPAAATLSRYSWGPNGYSWALPPAFGSGYRNWAFPYAPEFVNPGTPRALATLREPGRYILINCNSPNDHSGFGDREVIDKNMVFNLACMALHGDGHAEVIRFHCGNTWGDLNVEDSMGWRLWWNGGYPKGEVAFADGY